MDFIGKIVMFAGAFAPRGWAFCDGKLLQIAGNDDLFSLIGTQYGGDGRSTFGLPDFRGRLPIHVGHGAGLSARRIGERGGAETHTLSLPEMAAHQHVIKPLCNNAGPPNSDNPEGRSPAPHEEDYFGTPTPNKFMEAALSTPVGSGKPFSVVQPSLSVNFIICLTGFYPTQT